jgi:uncharacterized protein
MLIALTVSLLLAILLAGILVIRFRKRWIAAFNRAITNRIMSPFAARLPGFGIVTHVGRKTGRVYRTPVKVFGTPDAFLIALTYGRDCQWVRNVLSAGGCQLETGRMLHQFSVPTIVHDPTRRRFPPFVRMILWLAGANDFMQLSTSHAHGVPKPIVWAVESTRLATAEFSGGRIRLGRFVLLTICGFLIFALTMTFVPVLPTRVNYAARAGLLVIFAALWWAARREHRLGHFRPVFFAYFAAVLGPSLGFFFGDWGLRLFGLTTHTPAGIAVAKFSQAFLTVIGILAIARLCGENLASLYIRKGRLLLGLSLGFIGAAACSVLALQQPTIRTLGAAKLVSLFPWILLFVVSNALIEELVFRGLFLGRYEPLVGKWLAILSTALVFTLAHVQVSYRTPVGFLVVLFGLAIAWGWLMHKTGSLWGSALFHAGADLLIILPIFSSLGAA